MSKLALLFIPIAFAIAGKIVGVDVLSVVFVSVNILVLSELYSIVGNIYSIRSKKELPEYDAVAMLGKRLRNMLLKMSGNEEIK